MDEFKPSKSSRDATRTEILRKLWESVISSIVVRHPDPQARISISISDAYAGSVYGRFNLRVRDTRADPNAPREQTTMGEFSMPFTVAQWPGKKVAQLYLVGAWALYLTHEATELVSFGAKNGAKSLMLAYHDTARVLNIHDVRMDDANRLLVTDHWQRMNAVMRNNVRGDDYRPTWPMRDEHPIELTISNVVGLSAAKALWDQAQAEGPNELERLTDEAMKHV